MNNLMKMEPVRLYMVAVSVLALIAFYVPNLPVALILGVVGAVLGEQVRGQVMPMARVRARDEILDR